ncbi:MAG: AAA-like domain-containing protein [Drouetiella hepatica Uher 2000/2452]|jgi:hypothetical protein|uniref:AAA-like domain-containing protein n=1 Tax=Drouetiella hepatica Uher 2000/2452 TaxID=904376 RepID=A0A951QAK5_9CYAN|nr:AAA-like domain-containing protein [Drouetiella hepatica Uher 2000/2452]
MPPSAKRKKTTILFLGANPANSDRLDLETEVKEISAELERAQKRDKFVLKIKMAAQTRDIQSALLEFKPQIVHFAGHGVDQAGLVFEDASGQARLVNGVALAAVFKLVESFVECVVLNACYSEQQAAAIARYIPYVIGTSQKVGDGVARAFSFGFYNALGSGELYESAYNWGCSNIGMEGFSDIPTPILKRKSEEPEVIEPIELLPELVAIPLGPVRDFELFPFIIDVPEGSISTDSPLYIDRPPIEQECYEAVLRPGALIRIKAPRQMGKTSLQQRILHRAEEIGHKTGYINFQLVDPKVLTDLDKFLQWFCRTVTDALELEDKLEDHWKPMLSTKVRCTNYFQRYLLKEVSGSLTLGLDEVDQVFQHLEIADGFFSLLRVWHEQGKNQEIWKKLRLVIAHSKEVYIPLNINQSPFNVGLPIDLPELTQPQVTELVRLHGLNWSMAQVKQLMSVADGHPYLLRKALYDIAKGNLTLEKYLQVAYTEEGLYGDHLSRHLHNLREDSSLSAAMRRVVMADEPVQLDQNYAFKLRSMGLVELSGNNVIPLCNLYKVYFRDRLGAN